MATSRPCTNFLALPSEIRNHIYDFTTHATTGQKRCIVPCFALTQTCQQVRHEYRPICLKADVLIDWEDVNSYLSRFYNTQDGEIRNIELAPGQIKIFANPNVKRRKSAELDLLPILKFSLANKDFTCEFLNCDASRCECGRNHIKDNGLSTEHLQPLLAADVVTVQKLLLHRNKDWIADVIEGRIRKLMISQIGTSKCPQCKFSIGSGKNKQLHSEFKRIQKRQAIRQLGFSTNGNEGLSPFEVFATPSAFDEYMERVGLDGIFLENEYNFIWDHDWIEQIPRWDTVGSSMETAQTTSSESDA